MLLQFFILISLFSFDFCFQENVRKKYSNSSLLGSNNARMNLACKLAITENIKAHQQIEEKRYIFKKTPCHAQVIPISDGLSIITKKLTFTKR